MDELSDAHEYDLSTLTNEEDNAYIGFCKNLPLLISFSNLEKTLQFMLYQMAKQEETIKKQAQSIQDTLALRQEIQSLDSRVDVQEKLLAQKDAELTEMRKAQDRLFTENLNLWRNVRSLEVDLEATKTNAGLNIDAVGSWRAEAQRNTESTQQLAIDLGLAFQKMETIQHDLQLIVQGQPHERIAKIERDLDKKIDLHKFAKELEVRDQLRKQTAEVLDSLSKRLNEQNACVDVLKASLDEKIGKDYVDSLWQRQDSKSVDYEKVQAIIDEKLDGLKSQQMNQARLQGDDAERLKPLEQIESRVYTAEGDIRSCREEISHNQELIARLTSTISCLATESRLQIVAKAVRELEKRTNGLDTAKILEKLEEKTDKVTFNVFKDNVSQYIFDASSGINASRSTFKCLSCDKPGFLKIFLQDVARQMDLQCRNLSALFEQSITSKQYTIVGNDGKLYRARDPNSTEVEPGVLLIPPPSPNLSSRPSSALHSPSPIPKIHHSRPSSAASTKSRSLAPLSSRNTLS